MNVLSLDLSSKKSGYALFNKDDNSLVDYGVWRFDDSGEWRDRIIWMVDKLREYLTTHKVDYIIAEDVPPTIENSQTVKILSALQGCVLALTKIYNIEIQFVSVRTWKQAMGIDLTHSKEYLRFKKADKTLGAKIAKDVKHYEKYMSIQNANKYTDRELVWNGASSKKTEDDIADAINIVLYHVYGQQAKYHDEQFDDILHNLSKKYI